MITDVIFLENNLHLAELSTNVSGSNTDMYEFVRIEDIFKSFVATLIELGFSFHRFEDMSYSIHGNYNKIDLAVIIY